MNLKKLGVALTSMAVTAGMLSYFTMNNFVIKADATFVYDSFNSNYDGWTTLGDYTELNAVESLGVDGSRCMYVTDRNSNSDGVYSEKGFYLDGGEEYDYSFCVYHNESSSETFRLTLTYLYPDGETYGTEELINQEIEGGKWSKISTKFKAPDDTVNLTVKLTTDSTANFYFDEFSVTGEKTINANSVSAATENAGLKDIYANYFRFGGCINPSHLNNSTAMAVVLKDYNSITCENEMKPDATMDKNKSSGNNIAVRLTSAASILDFCVKNNIGVRGHTLVWHSQTPQWFFMNNFDTNGGWASVSDMDQRMESYIKNIFSALKQQYPDINLYAYDVANECISDGAGPARDPGYGNGKSPWVQVYKDNSFIEKAFTYARKYAPSNCKLFYNDYNEYMGGKRENIAALVKNLYNKGILDGMGMQSHIGMDWPDVNGYKYALQLYSEIGCEIQVTELDLDMSKGEAAQGNKYKEVLQAIVDCDKKYDSVTAVVIWGVADPNWRGNDNATLYNSSYMPKESYTQVASVIPKSEWGDGDNPAGGGGEQKPVEPDENGYYFHDTFEDDENSWTGRGSATVTNSGRTPYKGVNALLTKDRAAAWNGAQKTLSTSVFKPGNEYSFSVCAKYIDGDATSTFKLTLQYTDSSGTTKYSNIATATAMKDQYVQLANTKYTIPVGASNIILYVETDSETTMNFYIDEAIGAVAGIIIDGPKEVKLILGDINFDGVVNSLDVSLAKKGLISKFSSNSSALAADVDQSGAVNALDIKYLKQIVLGTIKKFPVAEKPITPPDENNVWDNFEETASTEMLTFYQNSVYNMGNTARLREKIEKSQSGKDVTLAYIGGSITEGGGLNTCYAYRSYEYFKNTFSKGGKVNYINAGMSGTSSAVGLVRAQNDILNKNPDVIFIEFSVNDHPEEIYRKSFESLVKQCLSQENNPAVIIIINRSKGGYSMQTQMEAVGKNYNVPIISMDTALTKAFSAGTLKTDDYFSDEYHPHAEGNKLISDCIAYYYRQAMKTANKSEAYTIPSSTVYGAEYSTLTMASLSELSNLTTGSFKTGTTNNRFPYGWTFEKNSSNTPMTFTTTGKGIFIVFKSNQNSTLGNLQVTVNGKTTTIKGNRSYAWGGADTDIAYIQNTSGTLNVSMCMENASTDFSIWGIGVIK